MAETPLSVEDTSRLRHVRNLRGGIGGYTLRVHRWRTRGHRAAHRRDDGESRTPRGEFAPIAVVDVELSGPLPAIAATDSSGRRYGRVHALVRLHGKPLGAVDLEVGDDGVSASECADATWNAFDRRINNHLRNDGLGEIARLSAEGVPAEAPPRCLHRRELLLRDAPLASVIICTRNRPDSLARTLRSLKLLDYPSFEVIVVDGSSTTATANIVCADFDTVRYLHVGNNGLCYARNVGIEAASGTVVAFTDDDVVVDRPVTGSLTSSPPWRARSVWHAQRDLLSRLNSKRKRRSGSRKQTLSRRASTDVSSISPGLVSAGRSCRTQWGESELA